MTIKSSKELVNDALKEIKTISHTEASKLHKDGSCNLIDIRLSLIHISEPTRR